MASFMDHIEQKIYGDLLGKEKPSSIFTILDGWGNLIEAAKEEGRVIGCYVKVERIGDHYKISQVMINARREPIYIKGEFILARVCQAYDLDDSLYMILKSGKLAYLALDILKFKAHTNEKIEEDE